MDKKPFQTFARRELVHHARDRLLPEELEHFLNLQLLVVAALDDGLLLLHPLLHHRFEFYDFLFVLFDAQLGLGGHFLRICSACTDIRLQRLQLLRRGLHDLFHRHGERFERGHDDLLLDRFVRPGRQGGEEVLRPLDPLALVGADAGGLEDLLVVDFSAGGSGRRGGEDVELRLRGRRLLDCVVIRKGDVVGFVGLLRLVLNHEPPRHSRAPAFLVRHGADGWRS